MAVRQLEAGESRVENQYVRSVRREGNVPAQTLVEKVFELADRKWRGIGEIPLSGLALREEFSDYDAVRKFGLEDITANEPVECRAGEVLRGQLKPVQCPAFGTICTPDRPLGAPMVSSEGACAAYYQLWAVPGRRRRADGGGGGPMSTVTKGIAPEVGQRLANGISCAVPLTPQDRVLLGHGSGGKLSAALVRDRFLPYFGGAALAQLGDAGVVDVSAGQIAISTDSFVVNPLEFPGGNIGTLAVNGSVNDVAMMGARPLWMTVGFILEEGLELSRARPGDRGDVGGRGGGGDRDRRRRHEGRRAGEGRRDVHQHDGRGNGGPDVQAGP